MKYLLFSDPHWHAFQEFSTIRNGVNSRLAELLDLLPQMDRICVEHKINHVLCAGDLFHLRNNVIVQTYCMVYDALCDFVKNREMLVVAGNHDQALRSGTEYTALRPLDRVLAIAEEPAVYDIGDITVAAVPYIESHQEMKKQIFPLLEEASARSRNGDPILLAHAGIDGFTYGTLEYQVPEPLKATDLYLDVFRRVFLGHFHDKQVVEGVISIGAPAQHCFGDAGKQRGCMIYDSDTNKVQFVPLKGPKFVNAVVNSKEDFTALKDLKSLKRSYVRCTSTTTEVSLDLIRETLGASRGFTLDFLSSDELHATPEQVGKIVTDEQAVDLALAALVPDQEERDAIRLLAYGYLKKADDCCRGS